MPACAEVHRRYQLAPVWTREVLNHGNPRHQELGYYGLDERLQVGLWRVIALRRKTPARPSRP